MHIFKGCTCQLVANTEMYAEMANITELQNNEFWKKKFCKAVTTRDITKSGNISRRDYEIIVERYKKFNTTRHDKWEKLSKIFLEHCDNIGLSDPSEELSYEEFEECWLRGMSMTTSLQNAKASFKEMFVSLDIDDNGFITFNEWNNHYMALGIPVMHAKISFDAMDVDKDGKITKDEFVKYHAEFFFSTENKLNSAILFGPL